MSRFNSAERQEIVKKSQECLWSSEGSQGLDYLLSTRHLSEDVIRKFKLGFLPPDLRHMLAGRIIFPIEDASGHIVSISTRLIDSTKKNLPVYWHERYEKSFYLYGLFYSKEWLRNWGFAVVAEGQFDVLQLHNHGILNAVGLCGNKMSFMQLSLIYRYCDEVIMLLDKDENRAGQKGVERALRDFGKRRNERLPIFRDKITSVDFDDNLDPDEFLIKHGAIPLRKLIKSQLLKMREVYDS